RDKKGSSDKDKDAKDTAALIEELRQMRLAIERLEMRVNQLETERRDFGSTDAAASGRSPATTIAAVPNQPVDSTGPSSNGLGAREAAVSTASAPSKITPAQDKQYAAEDRAVLDFLRDTTINLTIDGYYSYNFNHPIGRVNLLRAYDVLSNA